MKLFKKIIPVSALSISGLLLVLAAIDSVSSGVALFEMLPLRIAVWLMLLLSLGVTLLACIEGSLRRPLVLLACLLQTPIAGGLMVLLVYHFAFPDQLPMAFLLPLAVLLVALASVLQAVVMILCDGIYTDEAQADEEAALTEAAAMPAAAVFAAAPGAALADEAAPIAACAETGEQPEASASSAPAPAAQTVSAPAPMAVPEQTAYVAITEEDEDELAPIPKKKNRKQPSFETGIRPMVPVIPLMPTEPVTAPESATSQSKSAEDKAPKKAYTDPFGLLTDEVKPDHPASAKSIFADAESSKED